MNAIVSFYEMSSPDNFNRWLDDIQRANDVWLEQTHNYIQWLFPNREPSAFNPEAPLLDDETVEIFISKNHLRDQVGISLEMMMDFYQLDTEHPWWVTKKNHNFLRITRILNTLREFKLIGGATYFFDKLTVVYSNNREIIGETTFEYWKQAFTGSTNESQNVLESVK